jgi:molybdopterin converting factor small subunit
MKVTVEFLSLPKITKITGGKSVPLDFRGGSISDLIDEIASRYGEEVRRFLLDDSGKLDMTLKVLLNKKEWIKREHLNKSLNDGDLVTIMMLVGGG